MEDKYFNLIDQKKEESRKVMADQDVITNMLANVPVILPVKVIPDDMKRKKKKVGDRRKTGITNRKNAFICGVCQQQFLTEDQFLDHVNDNHTDEFPFPCDKCKKRFAEAIQLKTHRSTHDPSRYSGEPQFQCEFCTKRYHLKVSLATHRNKKHLGYKPPPKNGKLPLRIFPRNKGAIKPRTASVKPRKASIFRKLRKKSKEHQQQQSESKEDVDDHDVVPLFNDVTSQKPQFLRPCHCSICDITLPSQIDFQEHLSSTHADYRRHPCPICKKRFATTDQLRKHKRIHNFDRFQGDPQFKCDLCDKSYHVKGSWYSHYQFVHLGKKKAPKRPTTQPVKQHHSIGVKNPNPKVKPITKLHQCLGCDLKFTYRYNLEKHMRRHANDRPYKCDTCSQTFVSKQSLQTHHKRVHENPSRLRRLHPSFMYKTTSSWDCGQCERKFKTASQLHRHKSLHTGEKPYECEICSTAFRTSCQLKSHSFSHIKNISPLKSYKCLVCGMDGFKKYNAFIQHRKKKHSLILYQKEKEKAFGCGICGKPYFIRENAIICALLLHNPEKLREKMFKIRCPVCPEENLGYCSQYFLRKHWKVEHSQLQIPAKYRVGIEKDHLLFNNDNLPTVTLDAKRADEIRRNGIPKDQNFDFPLYVELDLQKIYTNSEFVIAKPKPTSNECTICNQKFANGGSLRRHLKSLLHRTNVEKTKNEDVTPAVKSESDNKLDTTNTSKSAGTSNKNDNQITFSIQDPNKPPVKLENEILEENAPIIKVNESLIEKQMKSLAMRHSNPPKFKVVPRKCKVCHRDFSSSSTLSRHMKNIHRKTKINKKDETLDEVVPVISNVSSLSLPIKEEDETKKFIEHFISNFEQIPIVVVKQEVEEDKIISAEVSNVTKETVVIMETPSVSLPMKKNNQLVNVREESSQVSQTVIIKQEVVEDETNFAHVSQHGDDSILLEDSLIEIGAIQVKVENWEQNNEEYFQTDAVKKRGRGHPRKNFQHIVSRNNYAHTYQDNIFETDNLMEIGDIQVKVENWDEYNEEIPKQNQTFQTFGVQKRGRGRPRKFPQNQNKIFKSILAGIKTKARGRPRKIVGAEHLARGNIHEDNGHQHGNLKNIGMKKQGRGRPRKFGQIQQNISNSILAGIKRRARGRPRKNPEEGKSDRDNIHGDNQHRTEYLGNILIKQRGPGRPRKFPNQNLISKNIFDGIKKRARGRPRKVVSLDNPKSTSNVESKCFMCDFKTPSKNILRRHVMAEHIDNNCVQMTPPGFECNSTKNIIEAGQSVMQSKSEESSQNEEISVLEAVVSSKLDTLGDGTVIWNDKKQTRKILGNREMRLVLIRVDDDEFDLSELLSLSKIC